MKATWIWKLHMFLWHLLWQKNIDRKVLKFKCYIFLYRLFFQSWFYWTWMNLSPPPLELPCARCFKLYPVQTGALSLIRFACLLFGLHYAISCPLFCLNLKGILCYYPVKFYIYSGNFWYFYIFLYTCTQAFVPLFSP